MTAPLSLKQQRENYKFLFDELRKTVAARKDQRRKDQAHQQKMKQSEEKHVQKMEVPPIKKGVPTNPEAGPTDTIPAMLSPGEAVIPKKAAQNPVNKPIIKAMVREGRSDKNLSVPMPEGFMCGTSKVKGYASGSPEVNPSHIGYHNARLSDSEGYGRLQGYANGTEDVQYDEMGNVISGMDYTEPQQSFVPAANSMIRRMIEGPDAVAPQLAPVPIPTSQAMTQDLEGSSAKEPTPPPMTPAEIQAERSPEQRFLDYTKAVESGGNYDIGRHSNASSASGAYGITDSAWKDIVARNPAFKDMDRNKLDAQGQDTVALEYRKILGEQLKAKGVEPTDANIRAAWYTGAGGLSNYLKDGTVPPGANAAEIEKRLAGEGGVPRKYAGTGIKVPSNQSTYKGEGINPEIPKPDENKLQSVYSNPTQVSNANKPASEGGYLDTIASGIQGAWDTIKDPKKLGNAISSFVQDTLGFNAQDAARFGLLVAGSRAIGYQPYQAIRYAANYTLQASDKRNTATALAKSQMELAGANKRAELEKAWTLKGGTIGPRGELIPSGFKSTGEIKQMTFDSGSNAGNPYSFVKHKQETSGQEVWVDTNTGKTMDQIQRENGNRPLVSFTAEAGTTGQATRFRQWGESIGKTAGNILDDELGQPRGKKDDKPNPMRSNMPTGSEIGSQAASKFREWGYSPDKAEQQNEMNNIISAATRDMVNEKRANSGATIKSIDNYIDKQIIMVKTGMDNTLFLTPNNTLTASNRIIEQKNELANSLRKSNPDAPEAKVNDLVINQYKQYQQEWQSSQTVRDMFNKQATDNLSGFYLFVQDRIKESNKRK